MQIVILVDDADVTVCLTQVVDLAADLADLCAARVSALKAAAVVQATMVLSGSPASTDALALCQAAKLQPKKPPVAP